MKKVRASLLDHDFGNQRENFNPRFQLWEFTTFSWGPFGVKQQPKQLLREKRGGPMSFQGSFGKDLRDRLRKVEIMEERKMAAVMMRHTRLIGRVKNTAKLPRENMSADLK